MSAEAQSGASPNVVYPLKMGPTRRYLVDQRGRPFLIVGDSPQSMIVNLSLQDAKTYIADRKSLGFNALWVNLLCDKYTAGRADGSTYDHIQPFLKPNDLSTPNPRYFARVDAMIRLANQYGMVVFLDPIETGGWLGTLAGERRREGLRLRALPREALREVPEHRLDERQRLPAVERPVKPTPWSWPLRKGSGAQTRTISIRSSSTTR